MENWQIFKNLLQKHYKRYPKMQLQDMVKLIYQNEFGGGHLIANEQDSMKRLKEEYDAIKQVPQGNVTYSLFEDIGNGLYRLHLSALKNTGIDLATVNKFFVNTANSVRGSIESFEKKLEALKKCCEEKTLPYSLQECEAYLNDYKKQGYPPVSHSRIFQSLYLPAYRIVKAEYNDYFEVFNRIDSLLKLQGTVNVAIDGKSGAGKSTLAELIGNVYDCNIFHMDDFFLTPELRTEERLKEVGGNVDYVRFRREVIEGLQSGCEFQYRKYDCSKKAMGEYINVIPKRLNIIEGSYSMHPTLIDFYHLKIFLDVDEETQSLRILERNGPDMYRRFLNEWIPLENQYFEKMKIQEQSDLVFGL